MKENIKITSKILWANDIKGVSVLNMYKKEKLFIGFPEAAIWNFIERYTSLDKIVAQYGILNKINEQESIKTVNDFIKYWEKLGLILIE